ncbi:hypothetical protein BDY21DRAFT_60282 [Lineolata rhizophorae]|uniref:Uncharacterized protein n=1 Tax=Lineolata rhizophorae TaxID=578093 RepID=A0A6A6NW76_9PEZI|nr:hypothetical protein BDY21DRAFT_60282 [Lineolata rhizophorae]
MFEPFRSRLRSLANVPMLHIAPPSPRSAPLSPFAVNSAIPFDAQPRLTGAARRRGFGSKRRAGNVGGGGGDAHARRRSRRGNAMGGGMCEGGKGRDSGAGIKFLGGCLPARLPARLPACRGSCGRYAYVLGGVFVERGDRVAEASDVIGASDLHPTKARDMRKCVCRGWRRRRRGDADRIRVPWRMGEVCGGRV